MITYSNCTFGSEPLGQPLEPGIELTSQIVGHGIGPCANWYVLVANSELPPTETGHTYVWLPDTSLTSISPQSTPSDLIDISEDRNLDLSPLIACDPVGWWQFSWKRAWPRYILTDGAFSKMEFHQDLSRVVGPKWTLEWYGEIVRQSDISLEEGFWRGGWRLDNGYAITGWRPLQVDPSSYRGIGWDGDKLRPWNDGKDNYVFLWRYISPDKVPTREPNYAIEIRTSSEHSAYVELSFGCEHMRGARTGDHTYFGVSADRLNQRDYPYISPSKPEPTWPVIADKRTMFDSHVCDPVGLWVGYDWIGTVKYKYHRVFLADGDGYEQIVEIGSRDYQPPFDATTPFWWQMEGISVLYKEYSDTSILIDKNSHGATSRLEFSDDGCYELFAHGSYKFTGALADLGHYERRFSWERLRMPEDVN
ncbi:MAG: hypothetical protein CMJ72_06940 [Planctomycetaceae bacterium]|nr:hypothetical protein [Planctomycetaceae bacterium]